METEIEKKQRIERKKAKMRRVCQMLDIENWEKMNGSSMKSARSSKRIDL